MSAYDAAAAGALFTAAGPTHSDHTNIATLLSFHIDRQILSQTVTYTIKLNIYIPT